jgi:hypothetical protein
MKRREGSEENRRGRIEKREAEEKRRKRTRFKEAAAVFTPSSSRP